MLDRQEYPDWLRKRLIFKEDAFRTKETLARLGLNTVCEAALCPNLNECFSKKTATFMILGDRCSRSCRFCSVSKAPPKEVDPGEPEKIAEAVVELGLKYVVITSVTRDDLPDGGAGHFAAVVRNVRTAVSGIKIEVLVPDFGGNLKSVETVIEASPDVFGHNMETVKRLYPKVRASASYARSLGVLRSAKSIDRGQITKTGIMVGLGEKREDVIGLMADVTLTGCDILTVGQYLRSSRANADVDRFVDPEEFKYYEDTARAIGFPVVFAGAFVRSSYLADELYSKITEGRYDKSSAAAAG